MDTLTDPRALLYYIQRKLHDLTFLHPGQQIVEPDGRHSMIITMPDDKLMELSVRSITNTQAKDEAQAARKARDELAISMIRQIRLRIKRNLLLIPELIFMITRPGLLGMEEFYALDKLVYAKKMNLLREGHIDHPHERRNATNIIYFQEAEHALRRHIMFDEDDVEFALQKLDKQYAFEEF